VDEGNVEDYACDGKGVVRVVRVRVDIGGGGISSRGCRVSRGGRGRRRRRHILHHTPQRFIRDQKRRSHRVSQPTFEVGLEFNFNAAAATAPGMEMTDKVKDGKDENGILRA
jgi:hypothetical protein